MNVEGSLLVRFGPTGDFRQPWGEAELAEAVSTFVPGTPLLDGHGGAVVGRLTELVRSNEGLRLRGELTDPATIARLRKKRGLAISVEVRDNAPSLRMQPWHIISRHDPGVGYVRAVALLRPGERPARPGSYVWPVEGVLS